MKLCLSSDTILINLEHMVNTRKLLIQVQNVMSYAWNTHFTAIEKDVRSTGLRVCFSRGDTASALSRLFSSSSLGGMLERKDYSTLDMVLPFAPGSNGFWKPSLMEIVRLGCICGILICCIMWSMAKSSLDTWKF